MRELISHKVYGVNDGIAVVAMDEPGSGGAHHLYRLDVPTNTSGFEPIDLKFQNGPVAEVGTNGITHESLLAVVIDRLECFQRGPYACRENGDALECIKHALKRLQDRTKARVARGVEGTHTV
jgi:hypothetical protein